MRGMDAGRPIYFAGHRAERLYVVATGAVKLTGRAPDGTEVLLDVLGSGSFIATLPTLGGETYGESAWALTSGCLLSFSAGGFDAVLREHPSVSRHAMKAVGARSAALRSGSSGPRRPRRPSGSRARCSCWLSGSA